MGTDQFPGACCGLSGGQAGVGPGLLVGREMKAPPGPLWPSAWPKSSWGHALLPAPQALLKETPLEAGSPS